METGISSGITRRSFLKKTSLVIAAGTLSGGMDLVMFPIQAMADPNFNPHAFLEIAADDTVTVWVGQTNLGQGTHTGIPMIIADELDAAWESVRVKSAPAGEAFKDPVWHAQVTGGSTSIRHRWDMLRKVGAAARQMLKQAAADKWGISAEHCTTSLGKVIHPEASKSLGYGALVRTAGNYPVPENPVLKKPKDYTIIGSQRSRMDIPDKVSGKTVFGFDFTLPGMCIAVVARAPAYGAKPVSFDESAAMAVKGVVKVIPLYDRTVDRIAVCGETTWAAIRGRDALGIEWSGGVMEDLSDGVIDQSFEEHLKKKGAVAKRMGDPEKGLKDAVKRIDRTYSTHYISHAQAEPINCSAFVEEDRCRVWAPTQGATAFQMTAAALTGLPPEKVEVNILPAGGGFGLRGETDPVIDAVLLSKTLKRPVKVVYTREDDFANDYFRPANRSRIQAGLDKDGRITAWSHKVAAQSVMARLMPGYVQGGVDPDAVSGARDMPYDLPNHLVEYVMVDLPVPVGFWRSVGFSTNAFIVESAMDELAHAAGKDPVRFRLDHMKKGGRPYKNLSLLADKAGWDTPLPQGRSRGVAVTSCFESHAAHMAEVSVDDQGRINVHRMVCAVDCGTAVYPDAIRAQAEGGVIMGLSVAFYEKIEFSGGGVKTANYDGYSLLTMSEVPEIEVHIAQNNLKAGGIGEPVFPSVAPAVANAVFSLTGVRFTQLPFNTELLS